MYNSPNNQNGNNSQYGNANYPYNNMPQGNTQYTGSMPQQNTGYSSNPNPQYGYPNGYTQYPQATQVPNNSQYGSNFNSTPNQTPKKDKKKIIIGGIIVLVVVIVLLFFFLNKGKKGSKNSTNSNSNIDFNPAYEEIMNQYGYTMETKVAEYKKANGVLPTREYMIDSTKVDNNTIQCRIVEIYSTGKVYLDKCSVNNSEEIYSYGEDSNDEEIMQEYGEKALAYLSNYYSTRKVLPSTIDIKFEQKVECNVVNIYNDKTLYLGDCSVNGSSDKYSYGYLKEDGYVYISYSGSNNDVIGETTTANFESIDVQKRQIKCVTNVCSLDKYVGPFVAIKESDGRTLLYNVGLFSSSFTVEKNLEYTFLVSDNTVYGILLRNQKGEEALYSLTENTMKHDYGKYYYVWGNLNKGEYATTKTKNLLIPVKKEKNGKSGLISLKTNKVVLGFDYDTMFFDDEYINVTKDGKRGLLNADNRQPLLGGKFYNDFVLANYQQKYVLVYDQDLLQIINIDGKLIKKVAEIPKGYVIMNGNGYTGMQYQEDKDKAIFTVIFKTTKPGNPCAKYTYNLTKSDLKIDENKCEAFKG